MSFFTLNWKVFIFSAACEGALQYILSIYVPNLPVYIYIYMFYLSDPKYIWSLRHAHLSTADSNSFVKYSLHCEFINPRDELLWKGFLILTHIIKTIMHFIAKLQKKIHMHLVIWLQMSKQCKAFHTNKRSTI